MDNVLFNSGFTCHGRRGDGQQRLLMILPQATTKDCNMRIHCLGAFSPSDPPPHADVNAPNGNYMYAPVMTSVCGQ